jgi:HTH-type transcriptional regulator/antitoxin HigA
MQDKKHDHNNAGIRVIRTREDYDAMRRELDRLLSIDPARGSPERDRLEVLLVLLADYEGRHFPGPTVDHVDAIRFRMDQLGMKPRDLEPYLGGRSRVSEILGRKRPLSIAMIRALHEGLGIPAEALINPASPPEDDPEDIDPQWERFPIREMIRRGWIAGESTSGLTRSAARDLLMPLFAEAGLSQAAAVALYRRGTHVRAAKEMNEPALVAWTARVLALANSLPTSRPFTPTAFEPSQVQGLIQLSRLQTGPRLAAEWLADRGVVLVVEPHLPRTRLDGAAMIAKDGRPVIALTIRYDRLDHFWFTLLHEIAHVTRHLFQDQRAGITEYYDDLDVDQADDPREQEADHFARESLVPASEWRNSAVAFAPSVDSAVALADDLGVSPAVVAGRVRHEKRNYRLLSSLVGAGQVRRLFAEVRFD